MVKVKKKKDVQTLLGDIVGASVSNPPDKDGNARNIHQIEKN